MTWQKFMALYIVFILTSFWTFMILLYYHPEKVVEFLFKLFNKE